MTIENNIAKKNEMTEEQNKNITILKDSNNKKKKVPKNITSLKVSNNKKKKAPKVLRSYTIDKRILIILDKIREEIGTSSTWLVNKALQAYILDEFNIDIEEVEIDDE